MALFGMRALQPQTRRKRLNALQLNATVNEMEKSHRVSRLSVHPRLGPRDSIFPGNPDLYRTVDTNATCSPYLQECVLAMEDCCEEVHQLLCTVLRLTDILQAHSAQELIRQGTYDLPRINHVLDSERVSLPPFTSLHGIDCLRTLGVSTR